MEDRERALLVDEVLSILVTEADEPTLAAIRELTMRKGPDGVRRWLMRCAGSLDLWQGPAGWQPPMRERVCRLLGLASDADESSLAELCSDARFDTISLRHCLNGYRNWKAASGAEAVETIADWLATTENMRFTLFKRLTDSLFYKNGNPNCPKNADLGFIEASARVGENIAVIRGQQALIALADFLTPQLELGRQFALRWDEAKAREGLVDFDDLIRKAANLLQNKDMADWIRYKLDRQFDHILIDEAQDTNESQWKIIDALTDDFFSGEGAHGQRIRTIFTVGDTKQAIFGFQGTSPRNFIAARDRVAERMRGLSQAAQALRERRNSRELRDLDLGQSFRTADIVLQFVDRAIAAIGPANFGIDRAPKHSGENRPGLVAAMEPRDRSGPDRARAMRTNRTG